MVKDCFGLSSLKGHKMICFCWNGFPQYAARCVGAFVAQSSEEVVVVATRPMVPVLGMENLCKCRVIWLEEGAKDVVGLEARDVSSVIVSGWMNPAFNRFAFRVKKSGGLVVAMVDNNYNFSIKELIKAIRFRVVLKQRYDRYLVPGKSGKRLLKFYGVKEKDIRTNLYSADANVFFNGDDLAQRPKQVVFVGQLCARKNVLALLEAFVCSRIWEKGWKLSYFGCGPLHDELISRVIRYEVRDYIAVNDFKQPEQLANEYRHSRAFILPSIEEHWGLVVHEAALSGCLLLLSDRVGAADDLSGKGNAFLFNPESVSDIASSFVKMTSLDCSQLKECQEESLRLANMISTEGFVKSLQSLLGG